MDSDTVDPGWDGELMDNAFVFARHVHGAQLQLHRNKGDLQGFESQRRTRSGTCHGYKDVSTESKQTLTSMSISLQFERNRIYTLNPTSEMSQM